MRFLGNRSEEQEEKVKDEIISIGRRMYEASKYCKEYIMEVTGLTEEGYIEAIKRSVVMDCARMFSNNFTIEYLQKKLKLSISELEDLNKYKEKIGKGKNNDVQVINDKKIEEKKNIRTVGIGKEGKPVTDVNRKKTTLPPELFQTEAWKLNKEILRKLGVKR